MNDTTQSEKTVRLSMYAESRQIGGNALSTQQNNRALLLRLIKDHRVISRVELARITGLKKATITINVNEFLNVGLVKNAGHIESETGRRVQGICITPNKYFVISVRLTPSFFSLALFDINSDCLLVKKCNVASSLPLSTTYEQLHDEIAKLISFSGNGRVIGIGVGFDGLLTLEEWPHGIGPSFSLEEALIRDFGLPVIIMSSQYFSTYRWRHLSDHNMHLSTFIIINTGKIISSFLQATTSALMTGAQGFAGDLGRIIVSRSCDGGPVSLNDLLSTDAIVSRTHALLPDYPDSVLSQQVGITVAEVIAAYNIADPLAREVYDTAFAALGDTISALINIANPACVILNGDIPYNERVIEIITEHASYNVHPGASVDIQFDANAKSRQMQSDPVLSGISQFVTNRSFNNILIG